MKYFIAITICLAIGIGIGWYIGYVRTSAKYQHELLKEYQPMKSQLHEEIVDFHKNSAEEFKAAVPWEASSASIALAALKNLDTNDVGSARFRLASMIAIYYHGHSKDGDTNLLASIVAFAATDSVLSNAVYTKYP
jgi:hypothetical protein